MTLSLGRAVLAGVAGLKPSPFSVSAHLWVAPEYARGVRLVAELLHARRDGPIKVAELQKQELKRRQTPQRLGDAAAEERVAGQVENLEACEGAER